MSILMLEINFINNNGQCINAQKYPVTAAYIFNDIFNKYW